MRQCRQCRAPIENSFVLCPHCRAPQNDVWEKPSPAPKPERPRPRRRLLSILAFPSDKALRNIEDFLALLSISAVLGAAIGYSSYGIIGAAVGMFVAFIAVILAAFLWRPGKAGG
jgi:hypothetical protein